MTAGCASGTDITTYKIGPTYGSRRGKLKGLGIQITPMFWATPPNPILKDRGVMAIYAQIMTFINMFIMLTGIKAIVLTCPIRMATQAEIVAGCGAGSGK